MRYHWSGRRRALTATVFWGFALFVGAFIHSCAPKNENPAPSEEQPTTFVIVRHAEKAIRPNDDNPELTETGRRRAEKLAELFGSTGVTALYSTPFQRCEQTLEPLSKTLDMPITRYEAKNSTAFVDSLAQGDFAGKIVVVVGHSNTVPQMLNALSGGENYGQIDDADYDNVYIVTRSPSSRKSVAVTRLRLAM